MGESKLVSGSAAEPDRHYSIAGRTVAVRRAAAGLHLVATPIGNLGDITIRALEVLAGCDVIACEDTRVTRKLLSHYGVKTPLTSYHEHNAAKARPELLARLAAGHAVALVSDAGTPLISDPGYKLVRAAQEAGYPVSATPGPSAVLMALTVSGLPTDRFFFEGFLPAKTAARRARIDELRRIPATLVIFETGPRLAAALADLAGGLGARPASVCREMTKLYEEVRRGDLGDLAAQFAEEGEPKGEIVLVVAPPQEPIIEASLDDLIRSALARLSLKDAVSEIASVTGRPKREVYQQALALLGEKADDSRR